MVPASTPRGARLIDFGLIFFSSSEAPFGGDKYRLVLESTKFADSHGFSSVWIPERHFTRDGWLYPNPAVLQAALARETKQIHLRAGSVVMPLHDPLRVAEEWAMVDNLSGGRVGLSFASGWHPNDFVFFPEKYNNRQEEMYRGIQTVQKLWRGESIELQSGDGKTVEIHTYPTPLQRELPIWITAAGNPKTFVGAGEIGAGVLTHMYNQSIEELAEKIRLYRESLAAHGYDPQTGHVAVMLHTFVAEMSAAEQEQARASFREYLKSAAYLFNAIAYSRGQKVDLSSLSEQDFREYLDFVLERLISTQRVLFGTPEACLDTVRQLRAAGVSEIACQLDFGIDIDLVLKSMPYLHKLQELSNAETQQQTARSSFPSTRSAPGALVVSQSVTEQPGHSANANGHSGNGGINGLVATQAVSSVASTLSATQEQPASGKDGALRDIQARCQEEVSLTEFYNRLDKGGIQLASSFRGIEHLWRSDGEALGQIRLHRDLERDASLYQVHPTLLDACLQVLIAALPREAVAREAGALYLPTGLRDFRLHGRPGSKVWSHAVLKLDKSQEEGLFEGDVCILDEQGQLLVEAAGLQLRSSEAAAAVNTTTSHEGLSDWLYELSWEPRQLELASREITEQAGKWLLFMDGKGVGQELARALIGRGDSCIKVFASNTYQALGHSQYLVNPASAEHMQRLLKDVAESTPRSFRGIVHLWSLDATALPETNPSTLEADQVLGTGSALNLLQALITTQSEGRQRVQSPRTWFVTAGAQSVLSGQARQAEAAALAVSQSPLWGLGRTCAIELPELWGGLVDIDPQEGTDSTANQLLCAILNQDHEDQIAFRQGQTYVARLVRSQESQKRPLELRRDASYLITGGLWGLGLEVARWLARHGVRQLILTGRSKLPPRSMWDQVDAASRQGRQVASIRELERLGVRVQYSPVDVADEGQMAALIQDVQQQGSPPIRGVFHAASVWQDQQGQSLVRPLANLDGTALKDVFRPKIIGSWVLHRLFRNQPLDFFVSFSSGASLFGSAAQGNYAAAGAFMDALAHYQRATGQPALSIDWGAVSETGFGATAEGLRVHEYWESRGIHRITPQQVLEALELLIPQQTSQVGVLKLDWRLLQQVYPQLRQLPLVTHLMAEVAEATGEPNGISDTSNVGTTTVGKTHSTILQQLRDAAPAQWLSVLEFYLCEQVGRVLRLSPDRVDTHQPLTALGLDSLMAIELKNRIEHELGVRISIVTFLQGPSINQFATQLRDQLAETASVPAAPTVVPATTTSVAATASSATMADTITATVENQVTSAGEPPVGAGLVPARLLSSMVEQDGPGRPGVDANKLLEQIDQLSDQEIETLLSQMIQEEGL